MNQWIHVYICLPNRSEQVKLSDAKKTSSKSIEDKDGQRNGTPSQDIADNSATSILEQVSLVQIVQAHLDEQHLEHKWEVVGEHYLSVEFYCHVTKVEELVNFFINGGIGTLYNSYYRITPCLFYQSAKCLPHDEESGDHQHGHHKTEKRRSDFLETMKSRITVQQVVEGSRSAGTITFDYAVFLVCAGLLAATGLVENSSVVLVASMLVSPIMGPILAGTFGMSIRDNNLYRLGIVNELISLASCLLIGFCYGLIYSNMHNWNNGAFITDEMKSRGQIRSLGIGFLVALPSGVGVALSVLGNNVGSLVGVAISASLLPPMVNAGILFSLSLVRTISGDLSLPNGYIHVYSTNLAEEAATLAGFSICLTLLNIFCIIIMGLSVLKIKQVVPRASNPIVTKFWTQDLSVVRDLNVRAKRESNMENHDPYRTTLGLETLFDDMQVDPAYKTICASTYRNPHGKLSPAIDHTIHSTNPFAGQRGGSRRLQRFSFKHRDDPAVVLENEEDVALRRQLQTPPAGNGINLKKLFTRKETLTDLLQKRRSNNKFEVTKIAEEATSLNP